MKVLIQSAEIKDIRFPTSRSLDGSDAMNPDPDYSAAYIILKTNVSHLEGHGFTFTIGRGNEICTVALNSILPLIVGKELESLTKDMGSFYRHLTGDSQLRWLGPEKGVIHLATGAIINAVWDLWAKQEGKPVWKLVADLSPEEFVRCVDFTYVKDAINPEEALAILRKNEPTKKARIGQLLEKGYTGYTTSPGWLGYSEEKIRQLSREAVQQGWGAVKMKVGSNLSDDLRRAGIIRSEIGSETKLMMDANQKWGVHESIENMKHLAAFNPYWIEEPTSPDDILGHAAIAKAVHPIKVATGEHCQNRVIFKQLMQANAFGICQIDSCRVGGVNENLIILLMAAKFNIPVCPHAGGVGLCELVQHLSMIDFICISGTMEGRMIEYVDHLHEHFIDPVVIKYGAYMPPLKAGYSSEMKRESIEAYSYPHGPVWEAEEKASAISIS